MEMEREIPLEYYTERGSEVPSPAYVPGVDFDPTDEDDVAAVSLAMESAMMQENERLRRENERLRDMLDD